MADLNPETGQPVVLAEQPKEESFLAKLNIDELARLNLAALMRDIALDTMVKTWKPIQEKYSLPDNVIYDRVTGIVKEPEDG